MVFKNVDLVCIAETKLDQSFPESQFACDGFKKPYRFDVTNSSGGLLLYVNESIPSRLLPHSLPTDIQCIPIELNLRKQKWLVVSIYRPPSQSIKYFVEKISDQLDLFSAKYDNIIVLGDFNATPSDPEISSFMANYNLYSLINTPTCFKSASGRCIDLILTNKKHSFQRSQSFETGISDHHHLIYTMLKSTFTCLPPKRFVYRSFKKFSEESFTNDLINHIGNVASGSFSSLHESFIQVVNKHAPCKTRLARGNNKPHMNKQLRKAIMRRSRLKNKANKTNDPRDHELYKKQRNFVVNLNKQAKQKLFSATDTTTKSFWNLAKPFFSNKGCNKEEKVFLFEDDSIITDDTKVANTFNSYFVNITKSLPIIQWKPQTCSVVEPLPQDHIDAIICKFKNHPSVLQICREKTHTNPFTFSHICPLETFQVIMSLNQRKSTSGPIPTKVLKMSAKVVCVPLTDCFNAAILDGVFPNELKLANVVPVFKKGDSTIKDNYRPISILPSLSKVFERILFNKMSDFFEGILSKLLCGFRKKYSTQHALLNLLKHWQESLDNKESLARY